MAVTVESGVGISFRLPDGTLVWSKRDTWAEVTEDVAIIFGPEALVTLNSTLPNSFAPKSEPVPAPVDPGPPPTNPDPDSPSNYTECAACGSLKTKWVPPGVSKKTGRAYSGFYACTRPGCPGR
jgi:hypothetical protein